jgi:hypothetical protein
MASSVDITEPAAASRGIQKITFDWIAHTDGVVTGVETTRQYTGKVERFVTDPDAGTAPTDDYDITIVDEDGYDVLAGAGADRDATAVEQVLAASLGIVANSKLTFAAANAGSGGAGVAYLYLR